MILLGTTIWVHTVHKNLTHHLTEFTTQHIFGGASSWRSSSVPSLMFPCLKWKGRVLLPLPLLMHSWHLALPIISVMWSSQMGQTKWSWLIAMPQK